MATIVREIERKYDPAEAGPVALDAVEAMIGVAGVAAVAPRQEQILNAIYYDTKDLRLLRAGVTLRRHTGGQDAGWHLKLPADPGTRDEIRLPVAAPAAKVPKELAGLVRARARGAALAPVVRMRTSRGVLRLLDESSRTLAEIAADHVSAEPVNGSAATCWDEIEVELVTGDPGLLKAIDARLREAGARPAATVTKLRRALGDQLPASTGPGSPLTARSTAGEVVLGYLRHQVQAISRYDPLVRRDEPDAVHQMRVATRRARSALQAFGQIIEREATRPLCDELKWLAAELGQARDGEVLLARLTAGLFALPPVLVVGPVEDRLTGHFTAELARAGQAASRVLDGRRYLRLLDDLDALLADPPLTPLAEGKAGKVLAKPVRRAARRLRRALAAVPAAEDAAAEDRDAAIHEARKAAKRARYAAEAALPALGGKARRQAADAKTLQELLGDHHDSVVARAVLRDLAGQARAAGEDTFTYGVMHERQACQAAEIERTLPQFAGRAKK